MTPGTADPGRVRHATISDEPEIMEICTRLHEENGIFPMSPQKVRGMLHRTFERRGGVIGVVGKSRIEGCICLAIQTEWYSDEWFLGELFNFVLPEYRASTNARDLISFAQMCSDMLQLPLLIGIVSNQRTAAKVRMYQRQLGTPAGAFFVYNATTGAAGHG